MSDPLVETWNIHDRVNQYLLDAVPDEALGKSIGPKHRTVFQLFGHIHNVRLMWVKSAAPELLASLSKVDGTNGEKATLVSALKASSEAIETMIRNGIASGGRVKGFKPHVTAFVGYMISHESHHRGQIGWTLKHTGHPLSQSVSFGLWQWGTR